MRKPVARWEWIALAAILVAFAVAVVRQIAYHAPFDYDETVYALKGRAWLTGDFPTSGWAPYRGPALPAISWVIGHFTFGETPYKVVGLLAGLGLLLGVWALGRRAFGVGPALIAAAAIAAASEVQIQTPQFLTDVPTAALLTALTLVVWRALEEREAPARSLMLIGPVAFGVYSLRYGAAPLIAITLIAAAAIWWPKIRRAPRVPLLAVGGLAVAAIPHLVFAMRTFGAPWGALTYTIDLAHKDQVNNGLGSYVKWLPSVVVGRAGGTLAVVGVIATVWTLATAARARRWSAHDRAVALIGGVAIVDIVVLGIAAPSQPRYVFFPGAMLALAGADAVVRAWRARSARARRPALAEGDARAARPARGAPLVATLTLATMMALGTKLAFHRWDHILDHRAPVRNAALAIKARARGHPCGVLSTALPQMTWYSGCFTSTFGVPPAPGAQANLPPGDRFLVLISGVRNEPTGAALESYLLLSSASFFQERGDHLVTAYRLVKTRGGT